MLFLVTGCFFVLHRCRSNVRSWCSPASFQQVLRPEVLYDPIVYVPRRRLRWVEIMQYQVSKIKASQEMERNWPTVQLLAATGSAWLMFNFPPFPVRRLFYWPGTGWWLCVYRYPFYCARAPGLVKIVSAVPQMFFLAMQSFQLASVSTDQDQEMVCMFYSKKELQVEISSTLVQSFS